MGRALRTAALTAFLLGLSGCNLVVSEEPWFTAADAVPAPVLRDGLWLSAAPDCRVNESKPAERWPDCADASFVRGNERWSMKWEDTDERGRRRRTFAGWEWDEPSLADELLVANGDHLIAQIRSDDEGSPDRSGDAGEDGASGGSPSGYMYAAIRPVRHDDEGRVLELDVWLVACGPLAEPARSNTARRRRGAEPVGPSWEAASVTDRPFPGLTVVESNCVAESVEALRRAAVLSESLGDHAESHWVRDGWR